MEKVTGIGGVFIKAKDGKALAAWYEQHLGIQFGNNSYIEFKWHNKNPEVPGQTVFSFFKEDSDYFAPSEKQVMINFRVADLRPLVTKLKEDGVQMAGEMQEYEYGKFAWIVDPEGNKIELWEPVDDKL